jgi:hypothetical protein
LATDQIVTAYLEGQISRRTFVRRLTAAGVGLSAAIAYSQLLTPEWAEGAVAPDCDHYDFYCEKPPPQQQPQPQTQPQPQQTVLDTSAPSVRMRLSSLRLAALLATGRFIVRFTSDEPAVVRIVATLPSGPSAQTVARGTARFTRAGTRKIVVKLTPRGRRVLRRRRSATLTVTARAVDGAGNVARHRRRLTLRRRRR